MSLRSNMTLKVQAFLDSPSTQMSLALLIVLSISLVFIDTLVLSPGWNSFLVSLSFGVDLLFCGEILLRWSFEKKENRDWRLFLDTVAVFPSFLGVLGGLGFLGTLRPQALQRLRFIRLIRLLRLVRLGNVMARQCDAMAHSIGEGLRENLIIVISLLMIFFFGALGIRLVEPQVDSFADALWYSLFHPHGGGAHIFGSYHLRGAFCHHSRDARRIYPLCSLHRGGLCSGDPEAPHGVPCGEPGAAAY